MDIPKASQRFVLKVFGPEASIRKAQHNYNNVLV